MSENAKNLDELLSQARTQNPILAALIGVLVDGGRVVCTGPFAEDLLNMIPEVLFFEKRSADSMSELSKYTERDLIFVEKLSVDHLWKISHHTGAQIALISETALDSGLADYQVQEKDLRSATLGLKSWMAKVEALQTSFQAEGPRENSALILDRDGVLIEDVDYVSHPDQVKLRPDVVPTLKKAREKKMQLLVFTNQSGMGRGKIKWEDYETVTHHLQDLLAKEGVFLDRILKAPYFEQSELATGLIRKSLRKPRPGMIHKFAPEHRLNLKKCMLVGDCATDLMAGALAGVGNLYLIKGPRKTESEKWRQWPLLSRAVATSKMQEISSLSEIFL